MYMNVLIALFGLVSALPRSLELVPISKHAGTVLQGSYIVKLKQGISKSDHFGRLDLETAGWSIKYSYDEVFNGYAARLDSQGLEYLRRSSEVEAIFEDGVVELGIVASSAPTKRYLAPSDISSGLVRRTNGSSVDIYDIGTGIYLQHTQFGGRATWGATFGGYASADGNGISTFYASLAAGSTYGFATQANLVAVKVLSDAGSGSTSNIIAAINWVISSAQASGRPSIAMTGIGGSANTALDSAVNSAISSGIHFVVAAGNSNVDGSNTSPARVPAAVTVGAVDANGNRAPFSNYGSVVDIYYYGVSAVGAWIGSTTATNTLSGTGVAMARVAGILALAIDRYGNRSPAVLVADLKTHARNVNGTLVAQPW